MNSTLASIYGTGMAKQASAEVYDLNSISGAELLEALESGEFELDGGFDKEAGIDLESISGAELLEIMDELEADDEYMLNKMASDGSFEELDMAGRIMAHAFHDEMLKEASGDYIDVNDIDGATLMELLDSGEFELVKEARETALVRGGKKPNRRAPVPESFGEKASRMTGGQYRRASRDFARSAYDSHKKMKATANLPALQGLRARRNAKAVRALKAGAIGYGGPAAVATGLGVGAYKGGQYIRRKRNERNQG